MYVWHVSARAICTKNIIIQLKISTRKRKPAQHAVRSTSQMVSPPAVASSNNNMSDVNIEQLNNASSERFERQKQKKAAREAEASGKRRKKVFKKISYWTIGLAVVIGGGWLLINASGPKGPDYSQGISVLGIGHIADDATYTSYNSNPPTSGPHYANPASARFYDKELPDEQLVHNLEHGNIWIAYKPDLPGNIIDILKDFSGGNVVVTPRSKNDADIALAAWGRLDKFSIEASGINKQRIKDFISRYQNKGPESVNIQGYLR